MRQLINKVLESKTQPMSQGLQELGIKVGKLYTDHGLPIDMALGRLDYTEAQKLSILDGACQWLVEHRRQSGATDKALDRQRRANQKIISDFISKGEAGLY